MNKTEQNIIVKQFFSGGKTKQMQNIKITYKNIKELKPYKKNAKKHPKQQIEQIANSIKEFGFTQPVIIDSNNCVVAGHGRILGAKKAGLKEVPTVCLEELTEEQIKAYRLVDNKLNETGWEDKLLKEELDELQRVFDMELFGFEGDIIEQELEVEPEVPFTEILNEENNYIVLKFNNKIDWLNAMGLFGIEKVKAYPTKKDGNKKTFGDRAGVGRVIDGVKALERINENEV